MAMNTVIFTDLDGSLLDAGSYSFDSALPALKQVRERDIPLVLISSKTRAEVEVWKQRLGNLHPFVVENGGGIYLPKGYFPFAVPETEERDEQLLISLGMPYQTIRIKFEKLRERSGISVRGFGDMSTEEVAELTGLALHEAELARKRDFTEPFVFPGRPDPRFLQFVESEGMRWTQGEFFHLMRDHDKGLAAQKLRSMYERMLGRISLVGIGDGLNDLPFLRTADVPVLIRKHNGTYEDRIEIPGLIRTRHAGAAGWNEAVGELLKR